MIKINLLPQELSAADSKNDVVVLGVIAGAAAVVLLGSIAFYMFFFEKRVDVNIVEANRMLAEYKEIAIRVDALQKDKSALERRKGVIENLIKSRLLYSVFMYDFVSILPDKIWLQNLTTATQEDNSLVVGVSAKTFSTVFIADWITSMESFPAFTFEKLETITTSKQADGMKVFNFSMKLRYRKPA